MHSGANNLKSGLKPRSQDERQKSPIKMNSNSKQILGLFQNLTQISTQIKIASFTDALAIIRFLRTTRNNLQDIKF